MRSRTQRRGQPPRKPARARDTGSGAAGAPRGHPRTVPGIWMGWRSPKDRASPMAMSMLLMLVVSRTCAPGQQPSLQPTGRPSNAARSRPAPAAAQRAAAADLRRPRGGSGAQSRSKGGHGRGPGAQRTLCASSAGSRAAATKLAHHAHRRRLHARRGAAPLAPHTLCVRACLGGGAAAARGGESGRARTFAAGPAPARAATARPRTRPSTAACARSGSLAAAPSSCASSTVSKHLGSLATQSSVLCHGARAAGESAREQTSAPFWRVWH